MKASIIGVIAVIIIVAVVVLLFWGSSGKSSTTLATTTISQSTAQSTSTLAVSTSQQTTSTIPASNSSNKTLTSDQVIAVLGTGWTAATQNSYGASNITLTNGTKESVQAYGVANFTNGGEFLTTKWIQFQTAAQATAYVNQTFRAQFPSATNVTVGTQGNAIYYFYAGDAINKGQAASVMYARDGTYAMLVFNQGTTFPLSIGQQFLTTQMADLKIS